MSHKEVLKLLIPLALGDVQERDLEIEGVHLDTGADRCADLLSEQFANSAYEVLEAWERVYSTAPLYDDSLQVRQNRVVQKMSELGRLDRAYFVQLGAALGYEVTIEELSPFMAGWSGAGDELGDEDSDWCWRIYFRETDANVFRAGESYTGELLSYSLAGMMQAMFHDLKPADTFLEFIEV